MAMRLILWLPVDMVCFIPQAVIHVQCLSIFETKNSDLTSWYGRQRVNIIAGMECYCNSIRFNHHFILQYSLSDCTK